MLPTRREALLLPDLTEPAEETESCPWRDLVLTECPPVYGFESVPVRGRRLLDLDAREPAKPSSRRFEAIALSSSRDLLDAVS
jgi:hypothetical protein